MTFTSILAAVYEDCNYASTPATEVQTRLKRYVNEGYRSILAEPGMSRLLESATPYTFASVADQALYALPGAHAQIRTVTDRVNDRLLTAMSPQQYRQTAPDPTTSTGHPVAWVPIGYVAVPVQPSDASELFAKSTSASDTQTLYIEGVITGGYTKTASVTLTGVTAVSLSASITTWIEVTKLYVSTAAVGTITLHEDSGAGTELGRIEIGATNTNYTGFYLWPTPSSSVTYTVDTRHELADLVNGTDEPVLPTDFHPMLAKYATFREWEHKDDTRVTVAFQQYLRWMARLKYWLHSTGDTVDVASSRQTTPAVNRVGPWYPAGAGW